MAGLVASVASRRLAVPVMTGLAASAVATSAVPSRALRPALAVVGRRARGASTKITLSESRLQEFMKAEIGHFALMSPIPVKLEQILSVSTPEQVAKLIHMQLPRHMATRIKHIEALPRWETAPELIEVHGILEESFRNLRLVEHGDDLEPLAGVIRDLRRRHKVVIPLLGSGVAALCAEGTIDQSFANQWLDTFLQARIGTEMLTAHFMSMYTHRDEQGSSVIGIVDTRCSPGEICREAAAHVKRDPEFQSIPIHVESHVCSTSREHIEFSFMPQYLALIVEELLKNSAAATLRHRVVAGGPEVRDETIHVIVAADQRQVKIQISDKGGGIPKSEADKVWSYCLSTLEASHERGTGDSLNEPADMMSWADPLAGLGLRRRVGMGLPLSKLYTHFLGGTLELMSLSGVGVDAYLSLRRLEVGRGDTSDS